MIAAAIHARVSTDEQAERGLPIRGQLEEARAYCAAQGWEVVEEFVEDGLSGALAPEDRPELARLLEAARSGRWSRLVVWDVSRLARDGDLSGLIFWTMRRAGVEVVTVSTPTASRLEAGIRRVLADEQREQLRRDVRRGIARVYSERRRYGPWHPFGYRWVSDSERVIEPSEAAVVRAMFAAADPLGEGLSLYQIGRRFGVERSRVWRILRNPAAIGAYVYGRAGRRLPDWKVVPGCFPPIVEAELWNRVQGRLDGNRARFPSMPRGVPVLPLSGLLVCSECGRPLQIIRTDARRPGVVRRRYACGDHVKVVVTGWAEGIRDAVLAKLGEDGFPERIARALNRAFRAGERVGDLEAEVRVLRGQAARLVATIAGGEVSDVRALAVKLEEVQRAAEAAEARLARARRLVRVVVTPEDVRRRLREVLTGERLPADRATLERLVDRVTVSPDGAAVVQIRAGALVGGSARHPSGPIGVPDCPDLSIRWEGGRMSA